MEISVNGEIGHFINCIFLEGVLINLDAIDSHVQLPGALQYGLVIHHRHSFGSGRNMMIDHVPATSSHSHGFAPYLLYSLLTIKQLGNCVLQVVYKF